MPPTEDSVSVALARVEERVNYAIQRADERMELFMDRLDTLVTRDEFRPVRMLVYGGTAILLIAVVGAIVSGVGL